MACLAVCLSLAALASVGCLPSRGEAMGLPQPPPDLNFTISVEGVVWCKSCRYAGYVRAMDASPLPSTYLYNCGCVTRHCSNVRACAPIICHGAFITSCM